MPAISFERLLKSARLALPAPKHDAFIVDRSIRLTRPDLDRLEGKVQGARSSVGMTSAGASALGDINKKLRKRLHGGYSSAAKPTRVSAEGFGQLDTRQRAIAKIHYFDHAGGGSAALKAHGKYILRDGERAPDDIEPNTEELGQNHAAYLEKNDRGFFYDKGAARIDGAAILELWAKSDLRHFRIILSAEEGGQLRDLQTYTREVMARAGAALDTELSWVAVDHRDTDNPHTHIVLRGRRANGQDLVLPRDFIKHGFRDLARDVASELLGERTPEQERRAYEREVRRHAPTRLDRVIEINARGGLVDLSTLSAPNGDPALSRAAKARAQELARMGLAEERGRGVFQLAPDWREKLTAMERHLDIRKQVVRQRVQERLTQHKAERSMRKGLSER